MTWHKFREDEGDEGSKEKSREKKKKKEKKNNRKIAMYTNPALITEMIIIWLG